MADQKSNIKSKVLRVSLIILSLYALGLMLIIGKLFPQRYMEIQKQLNMDILMNDELLLLGGENQVMFSSGNIQELSADLFLSDDGNQYEKEIEGTKYLVASTPLNLYDWKIVHILSVERLQDTINEVLLFCVGAIVVVLLLAFLLMGSMARLISYNIEEVTEEMDSFLESGKRQAFMGRKETHWNDLANRLSLHQKFWFYYGTVIILPMIIISMVVYSRCQHATRAEYEKSARILSDYSYQIIENRLYDETYTMKTILLDTQLLQNMHAYAQSEDEEEKKQPYYDISMKIQNIGRDCEISYYDTDGEYVLSWPNMERQKKKNLRVNIDYNGKRIRARERSHHRRIR